MKNNSWLKHLLENPSHFRSHISTNPANRNGLRSTVTRPVIAPWDIDFQMHCCTQAFTVPGCRRVSVQYSDCWLHFNELLEAGFEFSTNKDKKTQIGTSENIFSVDHYKQALINVSKNKYCWLSVKLIALNENLGNILIGIIALYLSYQL